MMYMTILLKNNYLSNCTFILLQGQERDVIVLSFVRANSAASIGFLSHRQRLNVALTRAKEVCYIIASFSSLEGNREWNSLIKNARKRRIVCTITSKEENNRAFIKNAITNKDVANSC